MSTYEKGRTYLLRKIRDDLSPMSVPPRSSLQADFPTYYEDFVSKWRKNRNISYIGASHCPTPSTHTHSFLLPQLDMHTFHHSFTLYLLRPSLHTINIILPTWSRSTQLSLRLYSTTIRQPLPITHAADHPNCQGWSRGGQKRLSILLPWSP